MQTHSRLRQPRRTRFELETCESRALLSTIPSAGVFSAYDTLNLDRMTDVQNLQQLQSQNQANVAQLVADGSNVTQAILAGGTSAAERSALRQARTLLRQGEAVGARINNQLIRLERQLNTTLNQLHQQLEATERIHNPTVAANRIQTIETNGVTRFANIVNQAMSLVTNSGQQIQNIDNQIMSINTGTPTFQGVNQGTFVGTLTHMGTVLDQNGNPTPVQTNLTSPFEIVSLYLNGTTVSGPFEITSFQEYDANGNLLATLDTVPGQSSFTGTVQATTGTNVPASGTLTAVFPGVAPINVGWQGTVDFDSTGTIMDVQGTLFNLTNTTPSGVPVTNPVFGSFTVTRQTSTT